MVERALGLGALDDRLDDPIAIGEQADIVLDVAGGDAAGVSLMHEGCGVGLEHPLDGAFGDGAAVRAVPGGDVEKHHRHPGVGDMGGDTGAHDAGADHRRLADFDHPAASSTVAIPWPPPMHWVASAKVPPSRPSSIAALPVMRAPVAPSGWPSAMAPPSILTRA